MRADDRAFKRDGLFKVIKPMFSIVETWTRGCNDMAVRCRSVRRRQMELCSRNAIPLDASGERLSTKSGYQYAGQQMAQPMTGAMSAARRSHHLVIQWSSNPGSPTCLSSARAGTHVTIVHGSARGLCRLCVGSLLRWTTRSECSGQKSVDLPEHIQGSRTRWLSVPCCTCFAMCHAPPARTSPSAASIYRRHLEPH